MSADEPGKSRWALSQSEIIVYGLVMLIAVVAPFTGLIFQLGIGGQLVNVLPFLWLLAALVLGAVYLGRRRRRSAADNRSDQFFDQ